MVFGNPPGPWSNILGVPLVVVVLCLAIVGFIVGIVWLRRIFSVDDDSGASVGRQRRHRVRTVSFVIVVECR